MFLLYVSTRGDTMKGGWFGARKYVMVCDEKERSEEKGRRMDVAKGVGWHRVVFGFFSHLAAPK